MPAWAEIYLTANHPWFYPVVFILLFLAGIGFPISADLVLIACAYLIYGGHAHLFVLIFIATAAILLSDSLMFWVGKRLGYRLIRVWPFKKIITETKIKSAEKGFQKQGYRIVFLARFMPGVRTVFMFTSGLLKLKFFKFILYDGLGILVVIPALLYSMKWASGNKEELLSFLSYFQWGFLGAFFFFFIWKWGQSRRRKKEGAEIKLDNQLLLKRKKYK